MNEREIKAAREAALQWEVDNRTSENRTAMGSHCLYYQENNPGCAVGRLVDTECQRRLADHGGSSAKVFHLLPDDVQALGVHFLVDLQFLHDSSWHFDVFGLSLAGQQEASNIATKYKLTVNLNKYNTQDS